tara:strand:+ start:12261 stop:12860 length:600 start_codon:yes stop_codon:yes gene_type:complete
MIGIINCNNGNVLAIKNMLFKIGYEADLVSNVNQLKNYKILFLPGVGSFDQLIKGLEEKQIFQYLKNLSDDKTLIGICVGMQILLNDSEEGERKGLSLIDGSVKKIKLKNNLRLPHIGWNNINFCNKFLDYEKRKFYFCHSFYADVDNKNVLGYTEYSHEFASIIINDKKNVIGFQFHPEKSHKFGLDLFKKLLINLNA